MTVVDKSEFELWLEWEHVQSWDNDDPEDDFFNMQVHLPSGSYYALNVWTYRMLERAHRENQKIDDNLGGDYILPPDLFVARRDRSLLEAVVRQILRNGVPTHWKLEVDEDGK